MVQENSPRADDMSAAPPIDQKEMELIQRTFKDNEALLKTMRAAMLGMELTDGEKKLLTETFASTELYVAVHKRFLPHLDKNAPIGQLQDVWLGVESMVFGQHKDTIAQALAYKQRAIEWTIAGLERLIGPNVIFPVDLKYVPNGIDELGIALLTRNMFIRHVEKQLGLLWLIAQLPPKKEETAKPGKAGAINRESSR